MTRLSYNALWMTTLAVALAACGDDSAELDGSTASSEQDGAIADGGNACTLPSDCRDYELLGMTTKACCSSSEPCGYQLPLLDEQTKMDFPETIDLYKQLTASDPNGRCAPLSFFFGTLPPLVDRRVPVDDDEDILLSLECDSYHLQAWGLPGCCLPDDTCGLSTDESWTVFANIVQDGGSPFNRAQCLSAEALNQQFSDSVLLEAFARTTASGTCDYAALDARLPPKSK